MQSLTFTKTQYQKMITHVDSHIPFEACGLLAGHNSKVEAVLEVPNQAQSEVRFVMDPIEQLNAFEWIDATEWNLSPFFTRIQRDLKLFRKLTYPKPPMLLPK